MDKKRLALLEKAFAAEVEGAFKRSTLRMMQTKSKLAETMVSEGLLTKSTALISGIVRVEGYELTPAGHMAYCMEIGEKGEA